MRKLTLMMVVTTAVQAAENKVGPWQVAPGPAVSGYSEKLGLRAVRKIFRNGPVPKAGDRTWAVAKNEKLLEMPFEPKRIGFAQKFFEIQADRQCSLRVYPGKGGSYSAILVLVQNARWLGGRQVSLLVGGKHTPQEIDLSLFVERGQNRIVLSIIGSPSDEPVRAELVFRGVGGEPVCVQRKLLPAILTKFDEGVVLLIEYRKEMIEARKEALREARERRLLARILYQQRLQALQQQRLLYLLYFSSPTYYHTTTTRYWTYEIEYYYTVE